MELASSQFTMSERWAEELLTPDHPTIGIDPLLGTEITQGECCKTSDRAAYITADIHFLKLSGHSGELPYQHSENITLPLTEAAYAHYAASDLDVPF